MDRKLTLRDTGTWALINFGIAFTAYWLVYWVMAVFRARDGGTDIDAVAASTTLSLKGLVAGIIILSIGVALRIMLKPRPQNTP